MQWPRIIRAAFLTLILTGSLMTDAQSAEPNCGPDNECVLIGGSYYARAPIAWDRTSPLPVLFYYHGYRQTGRTVMGMKALTKAANDAGALVIAPNGIDGGWSVRGAPSKNRDEITFAAAVVEDVAKRWPIDRSRLWVSGFSLGASMAWDIACLAGDRYAGFFPVAGAFWRPHPVTCPAGPVTMIHVHGRGDKIMPLEGRTIRERWRQGDVLQSFDILRQHNRCALPEVERTGPKGLLCKEWNHCDGGSRLALCLYDGGHAAPKDWYPRAFDWLGGTANTKSAG
ncbi:alpha/beta hydrolase family esterase [Nisaea nitritireducens]|uniref:alpha/beta hydrolase family esterase n=1 Tax=Nisaea nitritireducens TaxID=568392 RepID=UPI001868A254|nr:hypothetical protein [Nisaea nitritireducens]